MLQEHTTAYTKLIKPYIKFTKSLYNTYTQPIQNILNTGASLSKTYKDLLYKLSRNHNEKSGKLLCGRAGMRGAGRLVQQQMRAGARMSASCSGPMGWFAPSFITWELQSRR